MIKRSKTKTKVVIDYHRCLADQGIRLYLYLVLRWTYFLDRRGGKTEVGFLPHARTDGCQAVPKSMREVLTLPTGENDCEGSRELNRLHEDNRSPTLYGTPNTDMHIESRPAKLHFGLQVDNWLWHSEILQSTNVCMEGVVQMPQVACRYLDSNRGSRCCSGLWFSRNLRNSPMLLDDRVRIS